MNDYINEQELKEIERMKKTVMGRILTKEAYERIARLKLVKAELSNQLELYLLQLYQNGQIKNMITDDQIKNILSTISSKKEFKIRR